MLWAFDVAYSTPSRASLVTATCTNMKTYFDTHILSHETMISKQGAWTKSLEAKKVGALEDFLERFWREITLDLAHNWNSVEVCPSSLG
jgi:hypothetical protein